MYDKTTHHRNFVGNKNTKSAVMVVNYSATLSEACAIKGHQPFYPIHHLSLYTLFQLNKAVKFQNSNYKPVVKLEAGL